MCSISTLTLLENFLQSSGLLRTKCIRTYEWTSYVLEPTLCEVREIRTSHGNIISAPTICTWMAGVWVHYSRRRLFHPTLLALISAACWWVWWDDWLPVCAIKQSSLLLHMYWLCYAVHHMLWTRSGHIKKLVPSHSFDVCTDMIYLWFLYLSQLIFVGLTYLNTLFFSVTIATLLTLPYFLSISMSWTPSTPNWTGWVAMVTTISTYSSCVHSSCFQLSPAAQLSDMSMW